MDNLHETLVRCWLAVSAPRPRDERGDVPGWVMVTVMTAGLVAILLPFAGDALKQLLQAAFAKVQ